MSEEKWLEPPVIHEHIIKTEGTIFGILIKVHGLTHIKENMYQTEGGRKYHLTKFGLEPGVIYNAHEQNRKIQHELEHVSQQLVDARKKIEKLEDKLGNRQGELGRLNEKVKNQADEIKRLLEIQTIIPNE
jgi:peptidoglycan hydrolase CwlO-like protein